MITISKSWDEIQPCPKCGAWYVHLGRKMVLDANEKAERAQSADDIRLKYSRKFFRVIDYLDGVYDETVSRLATEGK